MQTLSRCRLLHTLVVSELLSGGLSRGSVCAINAARQLGSFDLLVADPSLPPETLDSLSRCADLRTLFFSRHTLSSNYLNGYLVSLIRHMLSSEPQYSHVMASSSSFGKFIIPSLYTPSLTVLFTDVTDFPSRESLRRLMYTGNVRVTVKFPTGAAPPVSLLTVRSHSFSAKLELCATPSEKRDLSELSFTASPVSAVFREANGVQDLSSASVVVSGGRGLSTKQHFQSLIHGLAQTLHGAVGATRSAVDMGLSPPHTQVGQTGTTVSPSLYIAVGLSGSSQHLVGMRDSSTIVAINQDKQAPIWGVAHLGIEGDLFTVIPELTNKLRNR